MKKTIAIIFSCIFIIVALSAALIFIFSGNNSEQNTEIYSLTGTWKVVSNVNNGVATITDNEFMVFDGSTAKDYRDDYITPYASSEYTIEESTLKLIDISRSYIIKSITSNILCLYENDNTYISIVKYHSADMSETFTNDYVIEGKWRVVCHANGLVNGEYLNFHDDIIDVYRNDETSPSSSSSYYFTDNHLLVDEWSKDMVLHIVSEDTIVLVETDTGYNWEIVKSN